jgi:hypothetical protein
VVHWTIGGELLFLVAGALLLTSVAGKLLGAHLAGYVLAGMALIFKSASVPEWERGEAS